MIDWLVVLLALSVNFFAEQIPFMRTFEHSWKWFEDFFVWFADKDYLQRLHPILHCFAVLVPVPIVIGFVSYLAEDLFGGLAFVLHFVILLFCFTDGPFYNKNQHQCSVKVVACHERYIAIIFWFMILGPLGASLYRLTTLLSYHVNQSSSNDLAFRKATVSCHGLLAWLPVRITALIFALVGNFNQVMKVFSELVGQVALSGQDILLQCAKSALGLHSQTAWSVGHANDIDQLIKRTLGSWLLLWGLLLLALLD